MTPINTAEAIWQNSLTRISDEMAAQGISLRDAIQAFERTYLNSILDFHKRNVSQAARLCGFHRNTMIRHMKIRGVQRKPCPKTTSAVSVDTRDPIITRQK